MCNMVIHSITKKIIKKYTTLANDPATAKVWKKEMCHKLRRISQGYDTTPGTSTVTFMTYQTICEIPKDQTIAYDRKVVNYPPP